MIIAAGEDVYHLEIQEIGVIWLRLHRRRLTRAKECLFPFKQRQRIAMVEKEDLTLWKEVKFAFETWHYF